MIGGVLGALAAVASAGHSWVVERSNSERSSLVPVVVATRSVATKGRLDRTTVALRKIPRRWVISGAVCSLDEAIGQTTSVPLWAGEQILAGQLGSHRKSEKSAAELAVGERGAVVAVDAETARAVCPGDRVDVVTVTPSSDGLSQKSRLVPGVRVLKVSSRGAAEQGLDPWVMLAVSPSQAQVLALAEDTGKVRMVLRGASEPSSPTERVPFIPDRRSSGVSEPHSRDGSSENGLRKASVVEVIRGVERETEIGSQVHR